jgi:SAM-dependent methyltransferase
MGGDPGPLSTLVFTCNICGDGNAIHPMQLARESRSCATCGSTVRWRSVIRALSVALFGQGTIISDFPCCPNLTGIGLSDWRGYAERLSSKFAYYNTFYNDEPWLDITDPPKELDGSLDFLIASDVFEHVAPPVERAFENSLRLLKPRGLLILTVPYSSRERTEEHYPDLHEYEIFDFSDCPILVNRTVDGRWQVFEEPVFHGADGEGGLEMRAFSESSLLRHLRAAGFDEIAIHEEACLEFGIVWLKALGRPILARRR